MGSVHLMASRLLGGWFLGISQRGKAFTVFSHSCQCAAVSKQFSSRLLHFPSAPQGWESETREGCADQDVSAVLLQPLG